MLLLLYPPLHLPLLLPLLLALLYVEVAVVVGLLGMTVQVGSYAVAPLGCVLVTAAALPPQVMCHHVVQVVAR